MRPLACSLGPLALAAGRMAQIRYAAVLQRTGALPPPADANSVGSRDGRRRGDTDVLRHKSAWNRSHPTLGAVHGADGVVFAGDSQLGVESVGPVELVSNVVLFCVWGTYNHMLIPAAGHEAATQGISVWWGLLGGGSVTSLVAAAAKGAAWYRKRLESSGQLQISERDLLQREQVEMRHDLIDRNKLLEARCAQLEQDLNIARASALDIKFTYLEKITVLTADLATLRRELDSAKGKREP